VPSALAFVVLVAPELASPCDADCELADANSPCGALTEQAGTAASASASATTLIVPHCGTSGAQVETPAPTTRIGAESTISVRSCMPFMSLSS